MYLGNVASRSNRLAIAISSGKARHGGGLHGDDLSRMQRTSSGRLGKTPGSYSVALPSALFRSFSTSLRSCGSGRRPSVALRATSRASFSRVLRRICPGVPGLAVYRCVRNSVQPRMLMSESA